MNTQASLADAVTLTATTVNEAGPTECRSDTAFAPTQISWQHNQPVVTSVFAVPHAVAVRRRRAARAGEGEDVGAGVLDERAAANIKYFGYDPRGAVKRAPVVAQGPFAVPARVPRSSKSGGGERPRRRRRARVPEAADGGEAGVVAVGRPILRASYTPGPGAYDPEPVMPMSPSGHMGYSLRT